MLQQVSSQNTQRVGANSKSNNKKECQQAKEEHKIGFLIFVNSICHCISLSCNCIKI